MINNFSGRHGATGDGITEVGVENLVLEFEEIKIPRGKSAIHHILSCLF